jgi:hypothetical protein
MHTALVPQLSRIKISCSRRNSQILAICCLHCSSSPITPLYLLIRCCVCPPPSCPRGAFGIATRPTIPLRPQRQHACRVKRIGLPFSLLVVLILIGWIWWNWDEVKKRPGISRIIAYVRGKWSPAPNPNGDDFLVETLVLLDGSSDFRIDGKQLECENKLCYATFKNRRVQINAVPKLLGAVAFSGGKDLQLEPGHYQLTVDRLILAGGTVVPADGICSVHLREDGQRVYSVECSALVHDGRTFEFKFKPDSKPPTIKHF